MVNGAPVLAYAEAFKRCLEECDVEGVRRLWAHVAPHLPQPEDDNIALATLHHARTQAHNITFKLRAYSDAWLDERGFPSGLPDNLKPKARRIYPRIVRAVGFACGGPPHRRELQNAVQRAVSDAINEAYADGMTDDNFVRSRMIAARAKVYRYA